MHVGSFHDRSAGGRSQDRQVLHVRPRLAPEQAAAPRTRLRAAPHLRAHQGRSRLLRDPPGGPLPTQNILKRRRGSRHTPRCLDYYQPGPQDPRVPAKGAGSENEPVSEQDGCELPH